MLSKSKHLSDSCSAFGEAQLSLEKNSREDLNSTVLLSERSRRCGKSPLMKICGGGKYCGLSLLAAYEESAQLLADLPSALPAFELFFLQDRILFCFGLLVADGEGQGEFDLEEQAEFEGEGDRTTLSFSSPSPVTLMEGWILVGLTTESTLLRRNQMVTGSLRNIVL